jgi:hypothetical protein
MRLALSLQLATSRFILFMLFHFIYQWLKAQFGSKGQDEHINEMLKECRYDLIILFHSIDAI